jgi:hypothetical protein
MILNIQFSFLVQSTILGRDLEFAIRRLAKQKCFETYTHFSVKYQYKNGRKTVGIK